MDVTRERTRDQGTSYGIRHGDWARQAVTVRGASMKRKSLTWLLVLLIGGMGCTRDHTVAKIKNPGDVALAFRRIGAPTVEPVRAGTGDVNLRLSAIDVDEDGYLQREGAVLRIECPSCDDGSLVLVTEGGLTASVDRGVAEIVAESRGAGRTELPFQHAVSTAVDIYPTLRTPAANVEYFEQTTEPVSELGWLLVPGAVLFVTGLLVIPENTVTGLLMFTPGLALSAFGGLHLVLPRDVQRFNSQGQPIQSAPPRAVRRRKPAPAEEPEPQAEAPSEQPEGSAAGETVDDAVDDALLDH